MALVFVGIDPDTGGDNCPAVFVDDETGDLIFQGWTVTDPKMLGDVAKHSPIADDESSTTSQSAPTSRRASRSAGSRAAVRRAFACPATTSGYSMTGLSASVISQATVSSLSTNWRTTPPW